MIRYFRGTVFNANAEAIVNTVNCDGVMGAGIALEFGLRYPEMYKDYEQKCSDKMIYIGSVDYFSDASGITIVNFPTKLHFKYPSRIEWIESGLKSFVQSYKNHGFNSVAFPKLGTAKGGLDWRQVKPLMEEFLAPIDLDVVICLNELDVAEGIERDMLDMFNSSSIEAMTSIVRLTSKQKEAIVKRQPLKRFWELGLVEGIGKKTYQTLFTYYYNNAVKGNTSKQLSMDLQEMGL